MSKGNPRKAIAAILPTPIETPERLVVKPMTLAMYAALERIGSPLVTGREPRDSAELLPSLYLLTHGAQEVFAGNLCALAFAWADTVPVTTLASVREACERQMKCALDVMPEAQKKTAGGTTDGSRARSTSPRRNTAGATARSSGRCRSRL